MYLTLCEDPVEAILNILLVAPITVRHLNDKELEMFDIPNVDSDVCIYDFRTADKDFDEVKVCLNDKLLDRSAKDKTETEWYTKFGDLVEIDEPNAIKSHIEVRYISVTRLVQLCTLKHDDSLAKLLKLVVDPTNIKLKILIFVELLQLRSDTLDANLSRAAELIAPLSTIEDRTDKDEPKRANSQHENNDPNRPRALVDSDDPTSNLSQTEILYTDPQLQRAANDNAEPDL